MGPANRGVRSQTSLKMQSFLTGAPPRSCLLRACWTSSFSEKDTLCSTGAFHNSFCLEKRGETAPILSLIDWKCLKYSSSIGEDGHFSSPECLIMCPGIALTSLHESEHWANRPLSRVRSKAPCLCASAPQGSRTRRGHFGTPGVRLHLWPTPLPHCNRSVWAGLQGLASRSRRQG